MNYGYDDTKDISLDRQQYPENSYVHILLDDSLLNLSPTNDDVWVFGMDGTVYYSNDSNADLVLVNWNGLGFTNGPIDFNNRNNIFEFEILV